MTDDTLTAAAAEVDMDVESAEAALRRAVEREQAAMHALEAARGDTADADAALERVRAIDPAVMVGFEATDRVLKGLPAGVQATALRVAGVDVDPWADDFPRLALLLHYHRLNEYGRECVTRALRTAGDLVAPVVDGRMLVALPDATRTCERLGACRLRMVEGARDHRRPRSAA